MVLGRTFGPASAEEQKKLFSESAERLKARIEGAREQCRGSGWFDVSLSFESGALVPSSFHTGQGPYQDAPWPARCLYCHTHRAFERSRSKGLASVKSSPAASATFSSCLSRCLGRAKQSRGPSTAPLDDAATRCAVTELHRRRRLVNLAHTHRACSR